MEILIAKQRANMPSGTNRVLDRRSLENGNEYIIPFLKPGARVLDVGCGSGSITKGIAERVGHTGKVVGVDPNKQLVMLAKSKYKDIENLSFECLDLDHYEIEEKFDLITSARTLQWLSNPGEAIRKMKSLLKPRGGISILDYNHEKVEWQPAPPDSMKLFYNKFLEWRKDAGFNNCMADELDEIFLKFDLKNISVLDASEFTSQGESDFIERAGIWNAVAETRGNQLVEDGYITEQLRLEAISDYNVWLTNEGKSMKLYLLNVSGFNE